MDVALLKSKKRGKFHQLTYDEKSIEIPFKKCVVVRPVYDKYVRLDLSHAEGNKSDLLLIHHFIKKQANTKFSPLKYADENNSWSDVVCKISNASWEPYEKYIVTGDVVNVVFSPGAFGSFGWVLSVKQIYA
jgi:hypothetical protein